MLTNSLHVLKQGGPKFQVVGFHQATGHYVYKMADVSSFYGRGSYFCDNAAFCDEHFAFMVPSASTLEGGAHRQLILASVLCGRTCDYGVEKDSTLVRPPDGYDSVRGGPHKGSASSTHSCSVTVVYDPAQVYPQYIVTYRKALPPGNAGVGTGAGAGAGAGTGAEAHASSKSRAKRPRASSPPPPPRKSPRRSSRRAAGATATSGTPSEGPGKAPAAVSARGSKRQRIRRR